MNAGGYVGVGGPGGAYYYDPYGDGAGHHRQNPYQQPQQQYEQHGPLQYQPQHPHREYGAYGEGSYEDRGGGHREGGGHGTPGSPGAGGGGAAYYPEAEGYPGQGHGAEGYGGGAEFGYSDDGGGGVGGGEPASAVGADPHGQHADPDALFRPSRPPFVIHPRPGPDDYGRYGARGDPVSALAVEEGDDGRPSLLYVASHTSRQGEGSGSRGAWTSGSSDADYADPHRGSRMTVLYDDDGADDDAARGGGFYGGRSVYSSFSAHPEARAGVLDGLHSVLFGGGSDVVPDNGFGSDSMRHAGRIRARPSHAYGPPFGPPRVGPGAIPPHRRAARPPGGAARPEEEHRMGVASVFPVSFGGSREGAACTVSPHGVRIHSLGGAVLADRSDESLRGSTCGISAPGGRHATVGGMSFPKKQGERRRHVHCVDLQRDLATVSSHSLQPYRDSRGGGRAGGGEEREPCVAALAADVDRGTLAAACADGTVRVLDGRGRGRCAEVARARAQPGGCAGVAVSGNLICAAGYATPGLSTPSSPYPYPFPASHVLIYDVRYLGRGGTPHVFSANRGGPRFVNFLPDIHMEGVERLLVGSGQTFGSFEVITPFEQAASGSTFFQPALTPGESMTTVKLQEGSLYCGTSLGRVLQYGLREYDRTVHAVRPRSSSGGSIGMSPFKKSTESDSFGAPAVTSVPREPLDVPSMIPQPPELSIDPAVLCASPDPRGEGAAGGVRGWNVFDAYILASEPLLSSQGAALPPRGGRNGSPGAIATTTTLGPLSTRVLVPPSARWLSKDLATRTEDGGSGSGTGEPRVFPTSSLGLKNLMSPDVVDNEKEEDSNGKRQARNSNRNSKAVAFPNPNKFLYALGPFEACYDANMTRRSHAEVSSVGHLSDPTVDEEVLVYGEENAIPLRYRLTSRPLFRGATSFNHVSSLGLWPGWDYGPTFHNAFASSVLTLLFFVGEIREAALGLQLRGREMVMGEGGMVLGSRGASITAELGRLFHWMKCLSVGSIVHPGDGGGAQVRAFAPLNFLAAFTELPEATNLALVDGVAGSAEIARRPEAFYRFLMQYIDRELGQIVSQRGSLVDRLQGLTFISIIEYARAPAKLSSSRALTVDLSYDLARVSRNQGDGARAVRFGEILRASLCREAPLRAWCEETRSYEAVVQRRIATGLPTLLSLSCCCAGRGTNAGLECWQQDDIQQWLPELVEVRIGTDGAVTVRELAVNDEGGHEWMTFEQSSPLLSKELLQAWEREMRQDRIPVAKYYRLDAVVSFVRADPGASNGGDGAGVEGHHVVHVRALAGLKKGMLEEQLQHVESCMEGREHGPGTDERLTLVSDVPLQERCEQVQEELRMLQEKEGPKSDQWLLFNGNNVTTVELDDVRSFNVKFKEPSIVLFRETTDVNQDGCRVSVNVKPSKEVSAVLQPGATVPVDALITTSITNGRAPIGISDLSNLPSNGDVVAIDAEFVCVQNEESRISPTGSKEVVSEPRNALARLSIVDCRTDEVIVDDYILPREPVVDYLTRFSGIRAGDLDPASSPHHLVTPQDAYLKVRFLMERGVIFLGHGLSQDFRHVNLCVPPNQVIDTAHIFHQQNQRIISLRYLTNYVFGRDMQQEVHDPIEDARAAHELYLKALLLKKEGKFDDYLISLFSSFNRDKGRVSNLKEFDDTTQK